MVNKILRPGWSTRSSGWHYRCRITVMATVFMINTYTVSSTTLPVSISYTTTESGLYCVALSILQDYLLKLRRSQCWCYQNIDRWVYTLDFSGPRPSTNATLQLNFHAQNNSLCLCGVQRNTTKMYSVLIIQVIPRRSWFNRSLFTIIIRGFIIAIFNDFIGTYICKKYHSN